MACLIYTLSVQRKIIITGIFLSVLCLVGLFALLKNSSDTNNTQSHESDKYPLLAKRLFTEEDSQLIINFSDLRKSLKEYYKTNNLTGSLYFEYLPTGTSIRVDGDNQEVAASLMKLPIGMVLYKASELNKLDLDKEITLKTEWLDDSYGNLYKKGAGYKLSLREAARIMLSESDNTALAAITASIEGQVSEKENPFAFLDADYSQNSDMTVSIGARAYSSFLKCLYFSCYLDKNSSEEILDYLTKSQFDNRLVSGVDGNTTVSHKIGTFGDTTQSDCGIIYVDKKNYVLCVMVDGPENQITDKHISELSRITFQFITQRKNP